MSALWAGLTGPVAETAGDADGRTRPRLRTVPPSAARLSRRPFAMVLIALFGIGMTGLLMLNTTLQNQAFESATVTRQATELAHVQADLQTQLDQASAAEELVRRATELGLRPNPYAAFLVLPSGKVIGKPTKVRGDEAPNLLYKSDAQIASEQATADAQQASAVAGKAARKRAKALVQLSRDIQAEQQKEEAALLAAKQPPTAAGQKPTGQASSQQAGTANAKKPGTKGAN